MKAVELQGFHPAKDPLQNRQTVGSYSQNVKLLWAHNCSRSLWGGHWSKGQQWQPSDSPWAIRGDQTWSGVWQKWQWKGSNWQRAAEGRESMGTRSQKGGTATSPPVASGHQHHRQSAVSTSGCLSPLRGTRGLPGLGSNPAAWTQPMAEEQWVAPGPSSSAYETWQLSWTSLHGPWPN